MTVPPEAARLIERGRQLTEEFASAARYGVPLPTSLILDGHEHGGVYFSVGDDPALFDAWVVYADAEVTEFDHDGKHYRRAAAEVNGLSVTFAMATALTAEVA